MMEIKGFIEEVERRVDAVVIHNVRDEITFTVEECIALLDLLDKVEKGT